MSEEMYSKWHRWSIEKRRKDYKVMIIEPMKYNPQNHFNVFSLAMKKILGEHKDVNPFEIEYSCLNRADRYYDQIIFPEAFLFFKDFKKALLTLSRFSYFGCVHIGLRSDKNSSHLFSHREITEMINELESLLDIVQDDISEFRKWIESEKGNDGYYNIACLFAIDINNKLRLCLHPKVVRSRIENSPLPEKHMTEANMYNLIVLEPEENTLQTITIQPLICSDVLLANRSSFKNPIDAVNNVSNFTARVPDKIDIVSIVSCTPQKEESLPKSTVSSRKWHPSFRDSFDAMAKDASYMKHQSATFLISNYQYANEKPYGLSGVFFPHTLPQESVDSFKDDVHRHFWGSFSKGADYRWLLPSQLPEKFEERSRKEAVERYILAVEPSTEDTVSQAQVLEFTINILPSHLGNQSRIKSHINNVKVRELK